MMEEVQESVARGALNPDLTLASKCLLLAATSICNDAARSFERYLQADEAREPEDLQYEADCTRTGLDQDRRVLDILAELEGLKEA